MATLTIDGVGKVTIDDAFKTLSPADQEKTVRDIVSQMAAKANEKPMGGYLSDIVPEIKGAFNESLGAVKSGVGIGAKEPQDFLSNPLGVPRAVGGAIGMVAAPLTGLARSIGGHGMADLQHWIGSKIAPEIAAKDDPRAMYETAKGDVDLAMAGQRPGLGNAPAGLGIRTPSTAPANPVGTGPFGVTLSEGQATQSLPAIQREQVAIRAPAGAAGDRAKAFVDQQRAEVAAAKDTAASSLDQFGQRIAQGPQEAAQLAQQSLQAEARSRKAGVTQAYNDAKALPGEIDAAAFDNIGLSIKHDLSAAPNPVIIDDKLTPFATKAISEIESKIQELRVPNNRASPYGQPPRNQITGISLEGVEQIRKRLSGYRRGAWANNAEDGRAASAVVDAFDAHIDNAVNGGMFNGDPLAIRAWNNARAAHADYKSTFGGGKKDPVGDVIQKIIGGGKGPASIPNDVADFIYGASGLNPNTLNVAVANRIKSILGEASPEWAGVKQGLFSRLVETPEGVTDWGPGRIAQRVSHFLNGGGKELAEATFSPMERTMLTQFADLHRALEVPQAGANWSNTSTPIIALLKKMTTGVAQAVGAILGNVLLPGTMGIAELVSGTLAGKGMTAIREAKEARQIVKQMPLVIDATRKWQKAMAAYTRSQSPPSSAALSVSTSLMARAFKNLGVDLTVQGPAAGRGDENQPSVPGPPGQ